MLAKPNPEAILDVALDALSTDSDWRQVLDALPVPIYVTDEEGTVTYHNRGCAEIVGREPRLGHDRWCVAWQLYTTTGDLLPHERCPMARAIQEQRAIRDEIVILARPDGRRSACRPYPTPLFDEAGKLTGAINMVIDVTAEQTAALAEQAARCRRLASALYNRDSTSVLEAMAERFEQTAAELVPKAG